MMRCVDFMSGMSVNNNSRGKKERKIEKLKVAELDQFHVTSFVDLQLLQ